MIPNPSQPSGVAPVLVSRNGAVLTLTLNRPHALNSFDGSMHQALMAGLRAAADDAGVRCVVLTGAGRAFCAGQDLADPALAGDRSPGAPAPDVAALIESRYKPLSLFLRALPVPTVAAVNGVAAGAGANLALQCDVVVAARSASFLQAFSKIGLIPDCGGTWLLPRLVGRARALALAMLAERLPAEDAERIGLIWQCIDDSTFADAVAALAARLAAAPTAALVQTRHALDASAGLDWTGALDLESRLQGRLGAAADAREGITAFLEKRPARFTDR
jgi:2-(1,2-epoxy-1,2-dihydrophenyl)acetyl-CoA isomerase